MEGGRKRFIIKLPTGLACNVATCTLTAPFSCQAALPDWQRCDISKACKPQWGLSYRADTFEVTGHHYETTSVLVIYSMYLLKVLSESVC